MKSSSSSSKSRKKRKNEHNPFDCVHCLVCVYVGIFYYSIILLVEVFNLKMMWNFFMYFIECICVWLSSKFNADIQSELLLVTFYSMALTIHFDSVTLFRFNNSALLLLTNAHPSFTLKQSTILTEIMLVGVNGLFLFYMKMNFYIKLVAILLVIIKWNEWTIFFSFCFSFWMFILRMSIIFYLSCCGA